MRLSKLFGKSPVLSLVNLFYLLQATSAIHEVLEYSLASHYSAFYFRCLIAK